MADLKKNLSLSAGALLALAAITGCGAGDEAKDAAVSVGDQAQSAASDAGEKAKGAASDATGGDDADDKADDKSEGASGSAASGSGSADDDADDKGEGDDASGSASGDDDADDKGEGSDDAGKAGAAGGGAGAAAGGIADAQGSEAFSALDKQFPGGTVTALDRDDDDDSLWGADVVVDGQVTEVQIAADGTVTETERDDDADDAKLAEGAKISAQDAVKAALEGRDGQIVDDVELDEDQGLTYEVSFDDADRNDADSVLVDAKTGEVVGTDD